MKTKKMNGMRWLAIVWGLLAASMIVASAIWTFHPKMIVTRSLIRMFTMPNVSAREMREIIQNGNGKEGTFQWQGDIRFTKDQTKYQSNGMVQFPVTTDDKALSCEVHLDNGNQSIDFAWIEEQIRVALDDKQFFINADEQLYERYQESALADMIGITSIPDQMSQFFGAIPKDKFHIQWYVGDNRSWVKCLPQIADIVLKTGVQKETQDYHYREGNGILRADAYHVTMSAKDIAYIMNAFSADQIWIQLVGAGFTDADGLVYVQPSTSAPIALDIIAKDQVGQTWRVTVEFEDDSKSGVTIEKQYHIYLNHTSWKEKEFFCISTGFEYDIVKQYRINRTGIWGNQGIIHLEEREIYRSEYDAVKKSVYDVVQVGQNKLGIKAENIKNKLQFGVDRNGEQIFSGNVSFDDLSWNSKIHWSENKMSDLLTKSKLKLLLDIGYIVSFFEKLIN